jgi:hypothetical protein
MELHYKNHYLIAISEQQSIIMDTDVAILFMVIVAVAQA